MLDRVLDDDFREFGRADPPGSQVPVRVLKVRVVVGNLELLAVVQVFPSRDTGVTQLHSRVRPIGHLVGREQGPARGLMGPRPSAVCAGRRP